MKFITRLGTLCAAVMFSALSSTPALAQTPEGGIATVRVPQCLQSRAAKVYIPCTGVVPVDSVSGNAISWQDLFATIQGSNGSGGVAGDPSNIGTIGGTPPTKGGLIAGTDGTNTRAILTDGSGRISASIYSLPSITGTVTVSNTLNTAQSGTWNVGITGTLPAFAATPTFNVGNGGLGTLASPLIVGCTDSSNVRSACAGSGGSSGGDASAANQTSVQAIAGSDASKAIAIQGVTNGKAIPVTGTFYQATQPVSATALPLPTGAATDSNLTTAVTRLTSIVTALQGTLTTSGTVTSSALPTGAATAAKQDTLLAALGSPVQAGATMSNVIQATATDRGAVVGTSAITLMNSNLSRKGFSIQNQSSTAQCYINGTTTATADYHSLLIGPGGYFEPDHHVGTGAISIICSAATTSVYAREW